MKRRKANEERLIMQRFDIPLILTVDQRGFWLARCGETFGELTTTQREALTTLVEKLALDGKRAGE